MTPMRYACLCSGISAPSAAWRPLGWQPVAFCEIDAAARRVLAHHYPGVPIFPDLAALGAAELNVIATADVVVAGTPCQAFSIAGLRQGLNDDRGNLTRVFVEVMDAVHDIRRDAGRPPVWVLWENVPGVLSDSTNAFGTLLAGLVGSDAALERPASQERWDHAGVVAGPDGGAAWRLLDAQHFGLAQRRERIFVVARRGASAAAECADALLPLIESLRWHPAPRRGPGEGAAADLAPSLTASGRGVERAGDNGHSLMVPEAIAFGGNRTSGPINVTPALLAQPGSGWKGDFDSETFIVEPTPYDLFQITAPVNRQNRKLGDPCHTLARDNAAHAAVAFQTRIARNGRGVPDEIVPALSAQAGRTGKGDTAPCVAFKPSHYTRGKDGATAEIALPLLTDADKGDQDTLIVAPHAFDARQNGVAQYRNMVTNPGPSTRTDIASRCNRVG